MPLVSRLSKVFFFSNHGGFDSSDYQSFSLYVPLASGINRMLIISIHYLDLFIRVRHLVCIPTLYIVKTLK